MKKVLVFAGTHEGRKLCEFLAKNDVAVTAVVATDYGFQVLPKLPFLQVLVGRLDHKEIASLIIDYDYLVDATHHYAQVISENIRRAADQAGKRVFRIIRPSIDAMEANVVTDIREACRYLDKTAGNILVTTGSKEILPYTTIKDFQKRVYLRMLPTMEAIKACQELGFSSSQLICMQGPFGVNLNKALLEQTRAKFLVTKETGQRGGLPEKYAAAKDLGVEVILISQRSKEKGMTLRETKEYFCRELGLVKSSFSHFPLFMSLQDKNVLVVGGGNIATRRIETLLSFGPKIRVIAPQINSRLADLEKAGLLRIIQRDYRSGDIGNDFLVIGATNQRLVNESVYTDAKLKGILVNIADQKEDCDFYFPAIFSDEVIIGGLISQGGGNHVLVKEKAAGIRTYLRKTGEIGDQN